jgi:nucleotide-binding universal stress UspA family protein
MMFQHILVATDGSLLSEAAVDKAMNFAREAGARVTVITATEPFHVMAIESKQKSGCDLISMASHGRRGVSALVIGSVTTKVLTHSSIPVLVYR